MRSHLTASDIDRFRAGEVSGSALLELSRHLGTCADCSALARDRVEVDAAARELRSAFGIEEARQFSKGRRWLVGLAACAAAVVVFVSLAIVNRRPTETLPPIQKVEYGRGDWNALVAEARRSGRVSVPEHIRELRPPADVFRGTAANANATLEPAGEAVETLRPLFRWTTDLGGPYVVRVFNGREEIMRSARLSTRTWTPERALSRGAIYTWQVQSVKADQVLPAPPAPPAMFLVMDEKTAADLAEARRRFPGDHLLLGLLCAQAGLRTCAASELDRYASDHPNDSTASKVASSVREW
jgi:hypothetical protein